MSSRSPLRRSRPPAASAVKVARILASAHHLFTPGGYEATSMDAIAAQADVGKATVHAHFGSKPELFAAVVAAQGRNQVIPLPGRADAPAAPVEPTLRRFAAAASALILDPATTAMCRMIAGERARFPELGPIFFQSGPARLQVELSNYLAAAMARGDLRAGPPDLAAVQFLVRHPGLRIAFSHGGGTLGLLLPRLEQAAHVFPAVREVTGASPTGQARQMFYDSLVFDSPTLRHLVDLFGDTQVMLGTDYPFNFHDRAPVARVTDAFADPAVRDRLIHGNARRFLGHFLDWPA